MSLCKLTIELKLPIEAEPFVPVPALTFSRWLPEGKTKGISVTEEDIEVLLWFDIQSAWGASKPSESDLKGYVNVVPHYIRAEITTQVESELAAYMQNRDFTKTPTESDQPFQRKYEHLGAQILRLVLKRFNRLIAYARAFKGQYWLQDHVADMNRLHGYFQTFESTGRIDDGGNFKFQPGLHDSTSIMLPSEDRYIEESEWLAISSFVRSEGRTPLVLELLARAEQLAAYEYSSSALTEAVTALEVAIAEFGKSQGKDGKLASTFGPRLGMASLPNQIEHMGLSGTIRYLLPLLLSETVLSSAILSGCQDAVSERHNVVHNGRRYVPNVDRFISSIKACCKILREYGSDCTAAGSPNSA